LEYDLHFRTKGAHLLGRIASNVHTFEENLTCRRLVKLQHRTAHRRLTATRFTYDTERFPRIELKGNVVYRAKLGKGLSKESLFEYEILFKVTDFKKRVGIGRKGFIRFRLFVARRLFFGSFRLVVEIFEFFRSVLGGYVRVFRRNRFFYGFFDELILFHW
jgi:hypothetical protein